MRVFKLGMGCCEFLHGVSSKKRHFKDWFFLHVRVVDAADHIKIEEVVQTLGFIFPQEETLVLQVTDKKELIVVSPNTNKRALSIVDKSVAENFRGNAVQVSSVSLANNGIEQMLKIISVHEEKMSPPEVLALKRLSRNGNVFIILDDDIIVLKQMQKILQGFGHVEITDSPEEFAALYKQYSPNVAFLDIHLKGARGTDILEALVREIDPFAHAVMISSDSLKETVLESKGNGAAGYIMKPFDRDVVYRNLLKAPTFVPYLEYA